MCGVRSYPFSQGPPRTSLKWCESAPYFFLLYIPFEPRERTERIMRPLNLFSFMAAYEHLPNNLFRDYANLYGVKINLNSSKASNSFRIKEVESLLSLVKTLEQYNEEDLVGLLEGFYVSYRIPRVDKEFDLLRITPSSVLNVELKSSLPGDNVERLKQQLERNYFYLRSLKRDVTLISYVGTGNQGQFYGFSDSKLEKFEIPKIIEIFKKHSEIDGRDLDDLFDPSQYLISPFNKTNEFIQNQYFLNDKQETIRNIIHKFVSSDDLFMAIEGGVGSGKSLLLYHMAKEYMEEKRVLVAHCGRLNEGHKRLNELGWDIVPVKELSAVYQKDHNIQIIFIDEAQRIRGNDFKKLCSYIQRKHCKCIFAFDEKQWLKKSERDSGVVEEIKEKTRGYKCKLKKPIRNNEQIIDFLVSLLSKRANPQLKEHNKHVVIDYYYNPHEVLNKCKSLKERGFEIINYTPSSYDRFPYNRYAVLGCKNAHDIIGQEFEKVAVILDSEFYYSREGNLSVKNDEDYYYSLERMMYQIATRAIHSLEVIILNNPEVLTRCCEILGK